MATIATLGLGILAVVFFRGSGPDVTIGVEGRRTVEIAGPRLVAAPFTPGDALAVRIADARPTAGGFEYDLRFMAFGPGRHELGPSLRRPDGTSPEARSELSVSVEPLILEDYSGELYANPSSPVDLHSGYTSAMRLAWGLWALGLVALAWYGHKRRKPKTPPVPEPSVVERLRSLLERAAHEPLSVEQQADLEQLLLAFWSKRLNLSQESLSETVERLRRHPQAGPQWNRVERWLHSRETTAGGSVARQLLTDFDRLN